MVGLDRERFEFHIAVVHLDGSWSFPSSLDEADGSDGALPPRRWSFPSAVRRLAELDLDVIVPHMFCVEGMTRFRSLVDLLDIPLLGNHDHTIWLATDKAKKRQIDYLRSRNASEQVPYVIQEVLQDPEHGCYAIFNKGKLTGFEIFDSVASCLVYSPSQKHDEQVMELVAGLGKAMNLTGQLALDLMHTSTGQLVPIECNPRSHSAICTLEGHQNLSAIFTDPDFDPDLDPIVTSRAHVFRYWIMDQIFLMLGFWEPKNCFKLSFRQVLRGGDAILCGDDPMPFLAMYLLQITSLLLLELFEGTPWLKIDFCIGKIVKEGGD